MKSIYVLGGARTPFATWERGKKGDGSPGGALNGLDVFDLGAAALRGALEKTGVQPDQVAAIVFGLAYHSHPNNCYGSRYIGLRAGLPDRVPCHCVNFGCGSGLSALAAAAQRVAGRGCSIAAAGGCESTSRIPKEVLAKSFFDIEAKSPIGRAVEDLALAYKITRADADGWALRSHTRALVARQKGYFVEEIVPAGGVAQDDHPLEHPDLGCFETAKAYYKGQIVTGANTHGLVDGGAALILADEKAAGEAKGGPLGRIVSWATAAVAPKMMAYASVPAIQAALENAGWKEHEVDLFEVNETFAAQLLIVQRELHIPSEFLNVNGGSISLGHPFGATGARLILSLLNELRRRKKRRGVASICVGGGQGIAMAVESI